MGSESAAHLGRPVGINSVSTGAPELSSAPEHVVDGDTSTTETTKKCEIVETDRAFLLRHAAVRLPFSRLAPQLENGGLVS